MSIDEQYENSAWSMQIAKPISLGIVLSKIITIQYTFCSHSKMYQTFESYYYKGALTSYIGFILAA